MAAAAAEMGEIEDIHSGEDGETVVTNGDLSESEDATVAAIATEKTKQQLSDDDQEVEGDEEEQEGDEESDHDHDDEADNDDVSEKDVAVTEETNDESQESADGSHHQDEDAEEEEEEEEEEEGGKTDDASQDSSTALSHKSDEDNNTQNGEHDDDDDDDDAEGEVDDEMETHEIDDDDDDDVEEMARQNGDEPIELHDSDDGDVMIVEEQDAISGEQVNGEATTPPSVAVVKKRKVSADDLEVIELSHATPVKKQKKQAPNIITPRRSTRNLNKTKTYADDEEEEASPKEKSHGKPDQEEEEEESDVEEVLPQDPLAMAGAEPPTRPPPKPKAATVTTASANKSGATIVVKDTKRLVEIAAKSNNTSVNKKEPTLVIIDTNSILSGRGPVPVNNHGNSGAPTSRGSGNYPSLLPMALPAQGIYPPNMRATITPIPISSSSSSSSSNNHRSSSPSTHKVAPAPPPPVLPTLTDDMFVVEAPSFIVPYVYEKPPVADFKNFLKEILDAIKDDADPADDVTTAADDGDNNNGDDKKPYTYFASPLGKFFVDIGLNRVQEYVQNDLLKQQKRKRDREGGQNTATNKTIHSLIKTLEYSKENNEPYKMALKKCEFCNFKTESGLIMAHHLETPHTKNYVYKCNFCAYEAKSPHDILFHTEAEHAVRGRLERAPSFHQCSNCPFEDNQKGKLSRHLVACARKFKPEKNLDPPFDWEPPAKIPRVPKTRQSGQGVAGGGGMGGGALNVSAYQAMKNSTQQLQFLSKMQLLNTAANNALGGGAVAMGNAGGMHRGRGRPVGMGGVVPVNKQQQSMLRPAGMVYKQTMSGGSVLVPANYTLPGNQIYQTTQKSGAKTHHQPSISITPLPRGTGSPNSSQGGGGSSSPAMSSKPGDTNSKNSFVICEICDGYIKDLEQLRNHMQWIHKVKIHPKMIYNRPPLNCQKCQFRFFTDQGLERHLLGSHGLVTSSMQDAANKSKDSGRCPVCGRVYQWKLLNHVARDHNMTLKPAHLSYKCTVCTATFGMYKQFENHVYSAHSVVAKKIVDKKSTSAAKNDQMMKPLKINDEITIIPQPAKISGTEGRSSPSTTGLNASTSKSAVSMTTEGGATAAPTVAKMAEPELVNCG